MTTFTRSARWVSAAASSTENSPEPDVITKPRVTTVTQRVALRPANKVQPVAVKPGKLQRVSAAASSTENSPEPDVITKPRVTTVTQRVALRPANKVQPVAVKPGKLQRVSAAASSTENSPEPDVITKPRVTTVTQRVALRPANKVQPVAVKPGKLQRSASLTTKCPEPKATVWSRPTLAANHVVVKKLPETDTVASLDVGGLRLEPAQTPSFSSQLLLPDGVPDIDADDQDNLQLCAEYSKDIFEYLVSLEDKFPVHEQYLKKCNLHITGGMRTILINWLMQVHARFQLLPETLFLTVSVIDRFLQAETVPHSKLQLVGTASMLLSAKYEEMYAPVVDDFVYVTDGACGKRDVLCMEKTILDKVDWSLGRPIPLHFLRRVSKAGQVDRVQHSLAKYILELSLLCYELSWVRPSEQAAAALCLSLKLWGKDWDPTLTHYGRYSQAQLAPTVAVMAALVLDADKSKHTATYQKFKSRRLDGVSNLAVLHSAVFKKIAGRS